jgi:hypothetical protein
MTLPVYRFGPGELLRKFTSLYKRRPNKRYDVLIDVAIVLGADEHVTLSNDEIEMALTAGRDEKGNVLYEVSVADQKSVFHVVFDAISIPGQPPQFDAYEPGAWEGWLSDWAADTRDRKAVRETPATPARASMQADGEWE